MSIGGIMHAICNGHLFNGVHPPAPATPPARVSAAFERFDQAHAENARVRRGLVDTALIAKQESAAAHNLVRVTFEEKEAGRETQAQSLEG